MHHIRILSIVACLTGGISLLGQSPVPSGSDAVSPFDHMVFFCDRCKTEVPENIGAGEMCPNCGAFFASATNADGSKTIIEQPTYTALPFRYIGAALLVMLYGGQYAWRRFTRRPPAEE